MEEGTITEWLVNEGQRVSAGDDLFEIETIKITNVYEATTTGVIRKIIANEGETHPVGGLLGLICEDEVSDADIVAFIAAYEVQSVTGDEVESNIVLNIRTSKLNKIAI